MIMHTETDHYVVDTQGNGSSVLLTRKDDGALVHMQGDDAVQFLDELESAPDGAGNSWFNWYLSQYDDVLKQGE